MSKLITIIEYATLTTADVSVSRLDHAHIPLTAFDWLCKWRESFKASGATIFQLEGRQSLRWDNYVGVVETPCGTRIEILPKHFEAGDCIQQNRKLLRKMIQRALSLTPREGAVTGLELFDAPINEWVMKQFLAELDHLMKRGIRFDYLRVEEEQCFLRGQLNVVAQMRQPPGRQHHFQIRHDIFTPDRAENRLLKLALELVAKATQDAANWRLANELRSILVEVPSSRQVQADLRAWSCDRLMAHYQAVKPWCELILNKKMPLAIAGQWQGMSMLFPMEKLFERYVAGWLNRQLLSGTDLKAPARHRYLCQHDNSDMFRLEPDVLLVRNGTSWVLDTKWKRLDQSDSKNNSNRESTNDRKNRYGLSQGDFYQLYAYGQKYLGGVGEMVLIYPRWTKFQTALPLFDLGGGLILHVLPFDLENDALFGIENTKLPIERLLNSSIQGY